MPEERENNPPFIQTQGMRLLQETERPERFLRAEYFRAGRAMGPAGGGEDRGTWAAVNRFDVARNEAKDRAGSLWKDYLAMP